MSTTQTPDTLVTVTPVATVEVKKFMDAENVDPAPRAAGPTEDPASPARRANAAFRMPLSPLPAVLFILVTLFIIGSDLVFSGPRVLTGMAIVLAGVPLHRVVAGLNRRRPPRAAPD